MDGSIEAMIFWLTAQLLDGLWVVDVYIPDETYRLLVSHVPRYLTIFRENCYICCRGVR